MYDKFDALIFDMDGTLVDSGQLHEYTWTVTLNKFNIPIERAFMRSLAGVPTKGTLEILLNRFQLSTGVSYAEMDDFKEQCVREHMHQFVKPTALIEVVKQYFGKKPMAVGTGASTAEARAILRLCGLDQYLPLVVGADQVAHPKPAPDTFLRCADLLGIPAQNCVVFEDSQLGLQAATSAGMKGVDVLHIHNIENDYFL